MKLPLTAMFFMIFAMDYSVTIRAFDRRFAREVLTKKVSHFGLAMPNLPAKKDRISEWHSQIEVRFWQGS